MPKTEGTPTWRKFLFGFFYGCFLLTALAIGTGFGFIQKSQVFRGIVYQKLTNQGPEQVFAENGQTKEVVTFLILGRDDDVRTEVIRNNGRRIKTTVKEKGRSDSILIAQLNFKTGEVSGISIPRDVWVNDIPGVRSSKVNALIITGGPELIERYCESLLGVSIDRVIDIDFESFQELVDLVGGVRIDVPKRMYYNDNYAGLHIDLKPGFQTLNGYQSMGFVRFRKTDSDFERQQRQKDFMLAFKKSIMSRPDMLAAVADKAVEVTGNGLNANELAALALFAPRIQTNAVRMGMVPVYDIPGTTNLGIKRDELEAELVKLGFVRPFGASSRSRDSITEGLDLRSQTDPAPSSDRREPRTQDETIEPPAEERNEPPVNDEPISVPETDIPISEPEPATEPTDPPAEPQRDPNNPFDMPTDPAGPITTPTETGTV